MNKKIIDGKLVSEKIRGQIKDNVDELKNQTSAVPGLAAVLVGEDGPSQIYVRNKRKACENVGIYSEEHKLPENTTENHLLSLIDKLNNQENINGILIQLPLPDHIDETKIIRNLTVLLPVIKNKNTMLFHKWKKNDWKSFIYNFSLLYF